MLPAGLLLQYAYVLPKMYPNTAEEPVAVLLSPTNGSVTFVGFVPLKAPLPIEVTLFGTVILAILLHLLNAFDITSGFGNFLNGIFDIKALIYYISIIVICFTLTVQMLQKRRWS